MYKVCIICGSEDFKIKSDKFCSMKCIHQHGAVNAYTKIKCEYCNKEIIQRNYSQHIKKHKREQEKLSILSNTIFICEYCKKEFYGKLKNTNRFCCKECAKGFSTKVNRKEIGKKIGKAIKLKLLKGEKVGFCKINNDIVEKFCKICGIIIRRNKNAKNDTGCCKKCFRKSADYKIAMSLATKGKCGGYRENAGRGKCGWYKSYWCQSTYELAWVIYAIDNNIRFKRNDKAFTYFYENNPRNYYPDFLIDNNIYVEIKGYSNKQWRAKKEQFPKNLQLQVLYKKDLQYIFEYVINKYGRNYIELYENNPHKIKKNICKICGKDCHNEYCSRKCSGKAAFIRNKDKLCNKKK